MFNLDETLYLLDLIKRRMNELEVNHYKGTASYDMSLYMYNKVYALYSDLKLAESLEKEIERG